MATARTLFHLPYYNAAMAIDHQGDAVRYVSRRRPEGAEPATLEIRYRPTGPAKPADPGSLEYFLTERYCLYTLDRSARVRRLEIHHPPWLLQPADADIDANTMASAAGLPLLRGRPLLHFSKRQDVVTWWMSR